MSKKTKIRSIKLELNSYDIYLVEPEENDDFKISYVLAIPDKIENDTKIILESNNIEKVRRTGRKLDYNNLDDREIIFKDAIDSVIGNRRDMGLVEYSDRVSAPFVMPIIPTVKQGVPYYQQLSEECFDSSIAAGEFYRVDNQVVSIIDDVKEYIKSEKGTKVADKIFLKGYSSSGVFAQRFALCHPEVVSDCLIGGAIGSVPIPSDIEKEEGLDFPLGTNDYEKKLGKNFGLDEYRKIRFNYYVSEFEHSRKSDSYVDEFGRKAPMHDMSYMGRSTSPDIGKKQRSIWGRDMWKRFINIVRAHEEKGYDINTRIYKLVRHLNCKLPIEDFEDIFIGENFEKTSDDIEKSVRYRFLDRIRIFGKDVLRRFTRNKQNLIGNGNRDREYKEIIESIDDVSLAKDYLKEIDARGLDKKIQSFEEECRDRKIRVSEYPLKTRISPTKLVTLTQRFFESIDSRLGQMAANIMLGKENGNQHIGYTMYPKDKNLEFYFTKFDFDERGFRVKEKSAQVTVPREKNNDLKIYLPLSGDINDLYNNVHEITHTFDTGEGDTTVRRILGEVLPECMERMLDEYLLGLSDEEMNDYGFNRADLEQDINLRRYTTFLTRRGNTIGIANQNGDRELDLRYMLAELYVPQFMKYKGDLRRQRIFDSIYAIENNDFEKATQMLGLEITKDNNLSRSMAISNMVIEFENLSKKIFGEDAEGSHIKKLKETQKENIKDEEIK